MVTAKTQKRILIGLLLFVTLVLLVSLFFHTNKNKKDDEKVCLRHDEYHKLVKDSAKSNVCSPVTPTQRTPVTGEERDRRVLNDPLFPSTNRSESAVHSSVVQQIANKNLYNNTQEFTDRYRLVAYVTNPSEKKDAGGNNWKLFARQKNKNQGDFYMIPTDKTVDMKVMINNDIVTGSDKLRDIYTIPKNLTFNSPLLNETTYEVTELPMNDFTDSYN
jgi:hypothetical protein